MKIPNWKKIIDNPGETVWQNEITEIFVVVESDDGQWAATLKENLDEMGQDIAVTGIKAGDEAADAAREYMENNPLPEANSDGEIVFNQLVARNDEGGRANTYISVDYLFHKGSMQGATGSRLHVVTEDEREERMEQAYDPDNEYSIAHDLWKQAVDADRTEKGKEEYFEHLKRHEGDRLIYDWTTGEAADQAREKFLEENPDVRPSDIAGVEMTGGGRMFPDSVDTMEDKYDKIYNRELLEKIAMLERRDA